MRFKLLALTTFVFYKLNLYSHYNNYAMVSQALIIFEIRLFALI